MASISYTPPTMRRVAFLLAPVVLLCACSLLQKRVTYHMTFNVESDPIREELIWSSLRLMEDTATRLKTTIADKEVQTGSGSASITITLPTTKTADAMTEQLTAPFTLRFMKEVKAGEGDIDVPERGSFKDTGIGEKDAFWAEAADAEVGGKGAVRLLFTKEGQERLKKMLKENHNHTIGLFVRDRLVSSLLADQLKGDVVIGGIPSPTMAHNFADLVNVGLHVTFVPEP